MRVVIVYQTVVDGDAVGHDVIEELKTLKEEGVDAYVYAENYDSATRSFISEDAINLIHEKDAILIYHHAVYWERGTTLLKKAVCKKVIRYHNITPEHFFSPLFIGDF